MFFPRPSEPDTSLVPIFDMPWIRNGKKPNRVELEAFAEALGQYWRLPLGEDEVEGDFEGTCANNPWEESVPVSFDDRRRQKVDEESVEDRMDSLQQQIEDMEEIFLLHLRRVVGSVETLYEESSEMDVRLSGLTERVDMLASEWKNGRSGSHWITAFNAQGSEYCTVRDSPLRNHEICEFPCSFICG